MSFPAGYSKKPNSAALPNRSDDLTTLHLAAMANRPLLKIFPKPCLSPRKSDYSINSTMLKLVLITNASLLHRQNVQCGLEILDCNNGEIWAKLDAGTEAYYRHVSRSAVPWQQILDNIRDAARARPIVIQTLFMRINDQPPTMLEIQAYCARLQEIVAAGGQIKLVQIHTVARRPAESWVAPLANAEVDAIAETVQRHTNLPVAAF